MNIRVSAIALVFATALFGNSAAPLIGDAFYAPGTANNYGGVGTVNVGTSANNAGLLQFDLTTLPPGLTSSGITQARLILFVNKVTAAGTIIVAEAAGPWSEG